MIDGYSVADAIAATVELAQLAVQQQFNADELIVLTVAASYKARLRSYELLAQAFDLAAQTHETA
ncbi:MULTISPECIES: hypothetical protein [Mycetohabitans]|uniref:Uncharacterized protein n=1 Tax=Mycetohabitans rhizoxinica TaxID=412963 RepID=A0ABZ2Q416_9BURK|nr:hypothetical protein [Mycetohabitans sp. B2]MCF7694960.1 hypothetical protein [Mycetohabitans sp. B2]